MSEKDHEYKHVHLHKHILIACQNELARAEAEFIMNTDNQYIVPTSGNPLRGITIPNDIFNTNFAIVITIFIINARTSTI